jgi:hypothetical protein
MPLIFAATQTRSFYYLQTPQAGDTMTSDPANAYWYPSTNRRFDAVVRREICDAACGGSAIKAVSEFVYDNPVTTGNLRFEYRWDNQKAPTPPAQYALGPGNSIVYERRYDAKGNVTEAIDPDARKTVLTYDAILGFPAPGPYPTKADVAVGTAEARSWKYDWDTLAGYLVTTTDLDNNLRTGYTYDLLGRRRTVNEADARLTETVYDDPNRSVMVKRDLAAFGDGKLQTRTRYDQLGRVHLVQTTDGAPLVAFHGRHQDRGSRHHDVRRPPAGHVFPVPRPG